MQHVKTLGECRDVVLRRDFFCDEADVTLERFFPFGWYCCFCLEELLAWLCEFASSLAAFLRFRTEKQEESSGGGSKPVKIGVPVSSLLGFVPSHLYFALR